MDTRGLLGWLTIGTVTLTTTVLAHAGWFATRASNVRGRLVQFTAPDDGTRWTTVASERYRQMPPRHWRTLLIQK